MLKRLTKEIFIKRSIEKHGNRYNYSKVNYIDCKTPVIIICKKHGEFKQASNNHLSGHGCQKCNESKGEKRIAKFLDINKINYIRQAKFSLCKNKNKLPFDFYLPDYNCCIEFDGEQHFREISFFYNNLTPITDAIKTKFCRDNDINLIRINYKDLNRIDKILNESLKINFKQILNNFI